MTGKAVKGGTWADVRLRLYCTHNEDSKETRSGKKDDPFYSSKQNFALRLIGRLVQCKRLEEALEVVRPVYIVLKA